MIALPQIDRLEWEGAYQPTPIRPKYFIHAKKLVGKGCQDFWAHIRDTNVEFSFIVLVPVVCDFLKVFPNNLPRIKHDYSISFYIDLEIGTYPILIPLYGITPAKLRKQKVQL